MAVDPRSIETIQALMPMAESGRTRSDAEAARWPAADRSATGARRPPPAIIRVVLDNHSAHVSRETVACLASRAGRFEYVHTPRHGS